MTNKAPLLGSSDSTPITALIHIWTTLKPTRITLMTVL
jgi:hypothetical protein